MLDLRVARAESTDEQVIADLLQQYIKELEAYEPTEQTNDGGFSYAFLSAYWVDPDRHPFLFTVDGNVAGFALVRNGSEFAEEGPVMEMAEFFVLPAYRRLGIGRTAANHLFTTFAGEWVVSVVQGNDPAQAFWSRAISAPFGSALRKTEVRHRERDWIVWRFRSYGPEPA